jgi:hypothetical protein
MAQKNRANMLTDIVSNIYNNLINFITGQNAQDRFVNLLDSSPNILSDASQANGYVSTDANNEMFSSYYDEEISRADLISDLTANLAVGGKFYRINDAVGTTITLLVIAESNINLYPFGIDATTGEIGTYDITTDVFSPIVSSTQTLAQTLIIGNTSGANDIEFDATQGLLFDNTSRLREGTIDAGLGGLKGIAQICGAGYELKWENGRLYVMGSSGNTIRQSLYNLTTTPTVTDDDTLGYSVGSLWTLDDGTVYVCSDATTGAAVWAIGGIPDLQQVTDVGFTTTNRLVSDDGAGNYTEIGNGEIQIATGNIGDVIIDASLVTASYTAQLPDKPTSPQTFAMMSDIGAGGVPYTGATADVDLGIHSLTADTIGIGVAAGAEKLHIDGGATTTRVKIDADNGVNRILSFRTDDLQRWALRVDGIESGANSGGDFQLRRYNDAGAYIDSPIAINRANGNITTAQNINGATPTELGYLSGATSAIQTQLNSKVTVFASGADGTASSGTSNTISISVLIPANTFAVDDVIRINHRVRATGTTATRETRVYANTTNAIAGAIVVSTASLTNTILAANMQRFLAIKNATTNTEVITATTNLLTDYNNLTTAVSTLAINWTVDQYIIFAVNAINAADSIRATMYSIEKL